MTEQADSIEVTQNSAASRFEIRLNGELVGLADYFDDDDVRSFPHTEVDPAQRGEGIAGKLVGHALRETRTEGMKVEPICPYVGGFIRRHPEYEDLLA